MATILLLNGPNLDLLGAREPALYGSESLESLVARLEQRAGEAGHRLEHFQTNAEHLMLERIRAARGRVAAIVINPGAWAHTSLALADALIAAAIPYFEVHITNVFAREERRRELLLARSAAGLIVGCGTRGYELALEGAIGAVAAGGDAGAAAAPPRA